MLERSLNRTVNSMNPCMRSKQIRLKHDHVKNILFEVILSTGFREKHKGLFVLWLCASTLLCFDFLQIFASKNSVKSN